MAPCPKSSERLAENLGQLEKAGDLEGGHGQLRSSSRARSMQLSGSLDRLFYRVPQVAELLGVCNKTVYRLLQQGRLTASDALRTKLIPRASIEAFIASALKGPVQTL